MMSFKLFEEVSNEDAELGNGCTDKEIKSVEKKLGIKFGDEYSEFLSKYGYTELISDNYSYEIYGIVTGSNLNSIPNIVNPTVSERKFIGDIVDVSDKVLILEPGNGDSVWIDGNDNIFYYEHNTNKLVNENTKFNDYLVEIATEDVCYVDNVGLLFLTKWSGWVRKTIIDFGKKQYIVKVEFKNKNSKESLTNPVSASQLKLYKNSEKLFNKNQKEIFEKMVDWEYQFIVDAGLNVNKKDIKLTDFIPTSIRYDDYNNKIIVRFDSKYDTEHGIAFTVNMNNEIEVGQGDSFY